MSTYCRRSDQLGAEIPRPIPQVVHSAEAALDVILFAAHVPRRPEVIVLLLDPDLRGHTIVVVDGTESPDAVVEIIEMLGEAAAEAGRDQSFVLGSVRPGVGVLPGDVDRWLEMTELADSCGCELLEWFVLDDEVAWCPRDLLAERPRWPGNPS